MASLLHILGLGRRRKISQSLMQSVQLYLNENLVPTIQYSLPPDNSKSVPPPQNRILTAEEQDEIIRKVNQQLSGRKDAQDNFSERMLALIRVKGMRETDVYKAAGVDRKLFSRIASHPDYSFSKNTAVSLAFGLQLTLDEAKELLACAGFSLSPSIRRDVILSYFFHERIYNIQNVNDVLAVFGERTLSGR